MTDPNQATNFENLLDTNADEIERPPMLPIGSYIFRISSMESTNSSLKGTPGIKFTVNCLSACEDVDSEQLANFEAKRKIDEVKMFLTQWLTDNTIFRVKEFVEQCGVDTSGRRLGECVQELQGCEFRGYVKWRAVQGKPDEQYAEINSTAAVE